MLQHSRHLESQSIFHRPSWCSDVTLVIPAVLPSEGGGESAPPPACLKEREATERHLLIFGPTRLRIGRYIRPRESSQAAFLVWGAWTMLLPSTRGPCFLQLDACTMHYAEAEQTSHDVQAGEEGPGHW